MSLEIKPVNAVLNKDGDFITKASPYLVLTVGHEKRKGKQCKGGGKKPAWNQSFYFLNNEPLVKVQVWDKDTFSADDLLGSATYDLKKVYGAPNTQINQYVEIMNHGKSVGRIAQTQVPSQQIFSQNQQQQKPEWSQYLQQLNQASGQLFTFGQQPQYKQFQGQQGQPQIQQNQKKGWQNWDDQKSQPVQPQWNQGQQYQGKNQNYQQQPNQSQPQPQPQPKPQPQPQTQQVPGQQPQQPHQPQPSQSQQQPQQGQGQPTNQEEGGFIL